MDTKEEQLLIDLTFYDGLGSVIAKHGAGGGPKVFISGHMDEVGFMVTKITEKGFLEFQTLGGWWGQVMLAQQVEIKTREGKIVHGVIGSKPPHVLTPQVRNKPYEIKDMFIDIGASSQKKPKSGAYVLEIWSLHILNTNE